MKRKEIDLVSGRTQRLSEELDRNWRTALDKEWLWRQQQYTHLSFLFSG